jgi:SAM-dependent methyltransferase
LRAAPYVQNVEYCEDALRRYGDNARGVGYPSEDAVARYRVMLDLIRPGREEQVSLLDLGCGASHLYDHIQAHGPAGIAYEGLDVSASFLELSRRKHPHLTYHQIDLLDPTSPALPMFDYIVMNGILTYRGTLSDEEMFDYLRRLVTRAFESARVGLAFNVVSTQVDWERDDLFHVSVDRVLGFLARHVSRHVVVRHDYGLYEYTVYVYRHPSDPEQHAVARLIGTVRSTTNPAEGDTR